MVPPPHIALETPTGRIRFRPAWFGRLVPQVEVRIRPAALGATFSPYTTWRDATTEDELWTNVYSTTLAPEPPPDLPTSEVLSAILDTIGCTYPQCSCAISWGGPLPVPPTVCPKGGSAS